MSIQQLLPIQLVSEPRFFCSFSVKSPSGSVSSDCQGSAQRFESELDDEQHEHFIQVLVWQQRARRCRS